MIYEQQMQNQKSKPVQQEEEEPEIKITGKITDQNINYLSK